MIEKPSNSPIDQSSIDQVNKGSPQKISKGTLKGKTVEKKRKEKNSPFKRGNHFYLMFLLQGDLYQ